MSRKRILQDEKAVARLAEWLRQDPKVTDFDSVDRQEAWELAHSFSELEESFCKCLETYFPHLLKPGADAEQINDLLLDIGEEFRHILYHIASTKFYRYLLPPLIEA